MTMPHSTLPPPQAPFDPLRNHLLAALPPELLQRWRPQFEPVALALGECLFDAGERPHYAWFPTGAIVSLLYDTASGASAEIAIVGNDGVVGVALFLGGGSTPQHGVVQSAGVAARLPARFVEAEFERSPAVRGLLLRYTQARMTQVAQTAVCNRHHSLDQQLCRWLLLSLDRLPDRHLTMTHELIANMLGVRREGATQAALRLQQAGLIHCARGHVEVVDRPGLERRSCECYAVVRRECERLFPEAVAA
jgi:CRP-like cAMP-binding protein